MKKKINLRVAIAATLFAMVVGITSVNAQLLYKDSHLFIGGMPQVGTNVGAPPCVIIGPKYGIEYNSSLGGSGGLNFYILWPEANEGDGKIFIAQTGRVGIGTLSPGNYRLAVNGQISTSATFTTSDEKLKRNIKDMQEKRSDYVKKLKQLNGKSYEKMVESSKDNAADIERRVAEGKIPKDKASEALKELNERKKDTYVTEYGFIAQDVKKLFPELVQEDADGVLALNYTGLIPVLLEAIKDLQDRVEKLEQGNIDKGISIRSSDYAANDEIASNSEYLSQNVPNPVDGSTIIKYSLPEGVTQASIVIYSTSGSVIKMIPIDATTKSGSITLHSSDLAKGINIYNLTANGVVLGSKKLTNK